MTTTSPRMAVVDVATVDTRGALDRLEKKRRTRLRLGQFTKMMRAHGELAATARA